MGYRNRVVEDRLYGRNPTPHCFGDAVEAWDRPMRIFEFLKSLEDIEDPEKLAKNSRAHEPWRKGKKP